MTMMLAVEHEPTLAEASRTAVVVMGMHRSGTSALAGTLSYLGVDLPKNLVGPSSSNEKGHFESHPICRLHDRLLESAGTSWNSFLKVDPDWLGSEEASKLEDGLLKLAADQFGQSSLFVLKDPRICRLVPLWIRVLDHLGAAPAIVHIHRNPLDVAASLRRRNGMEAHFGLLVWLRHVLEAEFHTRGQHRHFTSYERLLDDWVEVVAGIDRSLQINLSDKVPEASARIDDFLKLPSKALQDDPVSGDAAQPLRWVDSVHAVLERWVEEGEDDHDFATLDEVRTAFDATCEVFAPMVEASQGGHLPDRMGQAADAKELRAEAAKRKAAEASLDIAQQALARAEEMVAEEAARRMADERRWEVRETELAEGKLQVRKLERQLEERFNELGEITRRLMDRETELLRARLLDAEGQLQASSKKQEDLRKKLREVQRAYDALQKVSSKVQVNLKGRIDKVQRAHDEVLGSTSWRMTKPLRHVMDTLRGQKND